MSAKPVDECLSLTLPSEVQRANSIDWGVLVDAYLMNAARVGSQYTGSAYLDRSGRIADGMTVVTPHVFQIAEIEGMHLVSSAGGDDHYVVVTPFSLDVE